MAFDEDRFWSALYGARHKSLNDLATASGMSRQMIAIFARGYLGTEATRAKIAAAMNVDPSAIWPMVEVAP